VNGGKNGDDEIGKDGDDEWSKLMEAKTVMMKQIVMMEWRRK
jgi:hypothetical protein